MTELEPLIKAFVKTLEEATNTSDLTSTQFECLRVVMDSLDIEPGTVVVVAGWEAMRVVGNGDSNELVWVSNTGMFHTNEYLVAILMDGTSSIQVVYACDLH